MKRHWRCTPGVAEGAVRGGRELNQQFVSARHSLWNSDSAATEFEEYRVSGGVSVIHCHVILHLIALLPNLHTINIRLN